MQSVMNAPIQPAQPAHPATPISAADDFVLARRACQDGQAFAELYRRHVDRVYRYLLIQAGHRQDAEDLTAQTFLEALQHIGRYRGEGEFAAWLLSIARHRWLDRLRQIKCDPLPLDESIDLLDGTPALDKLIGQRLRLFEVLKALRTLAPERADAAHAAVLSDQRPINIRNRRAAGQGHRHAEFVAEQLQHVPHAGFAIDAQPPHDGPAHKDTPCAQRQGLQHVGAAPHAAVQINLGVAFGRLDNFRQGPDGRDSPIELAAPVV